MPNPINNDLVKKVVSSYESIFEVASDPLVIIDYETGEIIECNSHFEKLFGYSRAEIVKMNESDLFIHEKKDELKDKLTHVNKGSVIDFKSEALRKDKRKIQVFISAQIFSFHNKDLIMSFVTDINPQLEKNEKVKDFYQHLDRTKTDFISLASHQMRSPITAINWYSEMLLSGEAGKLNKEQEKYFKVVYQSSQVMIRLINGLLNISRIELETLSITPRLTNVQKFVDKVMLDLHHRLSEKKQSISRFISPDITDIQVDPDIMMLIFKTLLDNAVEYTPEGGSIKIHISTENKYMVIKVTDTGLGIPKNQQPKIFTKLFRADNVKDKYTNGIGLNLYMVKTLLEQTKGKIIFESSENNGSTFSVFIPLSGMKKKIGIRHLTAQL